MQQQLINSYLKQGFKWDKALSHLFNGIVIKKDTVVHLIRPKGEVHLNVR